MQQWLWETWRFVKMIFPLLVVGVFLGIQAANWNPQGYGANPINRIRVLVES